MAIPTYKVILVGNGGVGKSAFLNRFVTNKFEQKYIATLGVEVQPCRFGTPKSTRACFNVWDCAGQEKFGGLRDGYYIGAQGAIFMFDLSSPLSFDALNKWITDVRRMVGDIPFLVIGAKSDQPRLVSRERVQEIVGAGRYVEVSAKSGMGVSESFEKLLALIQERE